MKNARMIELDERAGRLAREMRELNDAHKDGMPADVEAKWNAMHKDYESTMDALERERSTADAERRADESKKRLSAPEDPKNPDVNNPAPVRTAVTKYERRVFQMLMEEGLEAARSGFDDPAVRMAVFEKYFRYGANALANEERSLLTPDPDKTPPSKRAQTVSTTGGGYLIPQGFSGQMERAMLAFGPMLEAGTVFSTTSGNDLPWPTLDDTSNTGQLLGINTAETELALTFGQIIFHAYKYSSRLVLVPNELLQDEAIGIEQIIADAFGERMGRIMNTHFTTGDDSGKPSGVVTGSTLGVTAAAAAAITWDELIDLEHSVDRAYRNSKKTAYMMHDTTLKALKKLKNATTGEYTWKHGNVEMANPATINGYPYFVNNDMAQLSSSESPAVQEKTLLFGDFAKYRIRRVRDFSIIRLMERYAEYDQVAFLAFSRADGRLLDAGTHPIKHLKHPTS